MIRIAHNPPLRDIDSLSRRHFECLQDYLVKRLRYFCHFGTRRSMRKNTVKSYKKELAKLNSSQKQQVGNICNYLTTINNGTYENLKEVILCSPNEFSNLHMRLCASFDFTGLEDILNIIFKYDNFSYGIKYKNGMKYSAYELCKSLNIPVCPYCNRHYISILEGGKKLLKTGKPRNLRPPIDHFYPQNQYPLFSLSFYNLIPCCSFCNSGLKHDTPFKVESHIHPYSEEFGDDAVFRYASPLMNKTCLKIKTPDNNKKNRISASECEFEIETLYNNHSDLALELYKKKLEHSPEHFQSLSETIKKVAPNKQEFYRFYFGNYIEPGHHELRPLAKFTRDLVDELEIIKEAGF